MAKRNRDRMQRRFEERNFRDALRNPDTVRGFALPRPAVEVLRPQAPVAREEQASNSISEPLILGFDLAGADMALVEMQSLAYASLYGGGSRRSARMSEQIVPISPEEKTRNWWARLFNTHDTPSRRYARFDLVRWVGEGRQLVVWINSTISAEERRRYSPEDAARLDDLADAAGLDIRIGDYAGQEADILVMAHTERSDVLFEELGIFSTPVDYSDKLILSDLRHFMQARIESSAYNLNRALAMNAVTRGTRKTKLD